MQNAKSFLLSKTFWFNVLTVVVFIATLFGYTPNQQLAQTASEWLALLNPVINILLRFKTKRPIELKM